jgi:hypothetical protein
MKKMTKLTLTLTVGLGVIVGLGQASLAQSVNNTNEATPFPTNERDPLYGGDGSFNPFNLIHNANFSTGRDASQFYQDTKENLNNATNDFKRLQRERLQNQSQPLEATPSNNTEE